MTLKIRLEEFGVISVNSQEFTKQTIDTKVTLLQDNCSFKLKPIRFLRSLIRTPLSTNPLFDLNNRKPIQVMTISHNL